MTLVYVALAWCAGLVLASSTAQPTPAWWALAGGAALGVWLMRRAPSHRMVFVCVLMAALGAVRYDAGRPVIGPNHLAAYNDTGWLTLGGAVAGPPDVRDRHVNLRVAVEWVRPSGGGARTPVDGHALVQAPRYGRYAYGDQVVVSGQLLTPSEFDTFSYRDYLARKGVHSLVLNARVQVVGSVGSSLMFDLRERAQAAIADALPEPSASLLTGILLGIESGIAPDLRDDFNAVGATHIIAISGFNMTVLAMVISRVLGWLIPSRRVAAAASIAAIALYTPFVGSDAGVVRAAIMSSLLIIAPLLGRRTYVPASLAFSALLMSLLNPYVLWDLAFQLSFAAVVGMALFVEPLERVFRRALAPLFTTTAIERLLGVLSEPLIVTLAAQITTTPLIMLYFGRLSLASFLVNFFILPVQAPLLLLGAAATLLGLVAPGAAQLLYWADWLLLTWSIEIVRLFARLPWASVEVALDSRVVALFFVALLVWAMLTVTRPGWLRQVGGALSRTPARVGMLGIGAVVAGLLWITAASQPDGRLHVAFLDVGGGHAVLIRTPRGAQILVDGGSYPTRLLMALGDRLPFWDRELELVVVTQPRDATMGALPAVLGRYGARAVLSTGQGGESDAWRAFEEAVASLEGAGVTVVTARAGYRVELDDGVSLEVLHPPARPAPDDDPLKQGMALRVAYGDVSFLLTPDLVADAEAAMLASGRWLGATVLQLPYHGSPRGSSAAFLEAVSPQAAVVQVAAGNRQGYPAPEVLTRLGNGISVYRTDQHGTVEFTTDGTMLWVVTGG